MMDLMVKKGGEFGAQHVPHTEGFACPHANKVRTSLFIALYIFSYRFL
jgi:hypothetical protein